MTFTIETDNLRQANFLATLLHLQSLHLIEPNTANQADYRRMTSEAAMIEEKGADAWVGTILVTLSAMTTAQVVYDLCTWIL